MNFLSAKLFLPVILIVALLSMTPDVSKRASNIFDKHSSTVSVNKLSALGWQFEKWRALLGKGFERPIFGNGVDFSNYYGKDGLDPHNDSVRFFVEQWIVDPTTFLASYLCVFMHALKNMRGFPEGSGLRKVSVFLICYIPSYLLMSFSENLIRYTTVHWYVWAII